MEAVIGAVMPTTVEIVADVPLPDRATRCQAARVSEISPTARALRALEILQNRPGCTADELAQRLGVTDRAARRYVAILREAGIPVESVRGPYGGYRLGRGVRLPPLVFSAAEALGLVMAVLDGRHAAADNEDPVGSGLGKIIRALPVSVGRQAATMREHARAVPDRWTRPDPAITSALVEAVGEQRQVRIGYRSAAGHTHSFEVDPWSVVVRYGRWYLLCFAHHADAVRTYRIDRVTAVGEGTRTFVTPDGLDPVSVLEANLASGWEFDTRVLFDAPAAEVAPWLRPTMGRLEPLGEHRCVVVGSTSNPTMYAGEWLAGMPFEITVEGGPELRRAVAELAERMARAVAQ
jgi:predicted DNA-binding transcriptional regulator YafY